MIVRKEKVRKGHLVGKKVRKKKKDMGRIRRKMRERRKRKKRKRLVWLLIRGRVGKERGKEDGEANLEVL